MMVLIKTYSVLIDEEFLKVSGNVKITFTDIRADTLRRGITLQYISDRELGFGEEFYFPAADEFLELEETCNKYIRVCKNSAENKEAEYDLLAINKHQIILEANM